MGQKSYFEAMFGELSDSDGGKTFSLPERDFIPLSSITKQNKKKLKEAYTRTHEIRKFEIELYWKRATYFWAFELVALTGFGALFFKLLEPQNSLQITGALLLVSFGGTLITYLWMLVLLGSKSWQKNWEKHLDMLEYYFSGNLYKCMFLCGENPFSSSAASTYIAKSFFVFWIICLMYSLISFLKVLNLSYGWIIFCTFAFLLSMDYTCMRLRQKLKGSPHKTNQDDFSLTIRFPQIASASCTDANDPSPAPAACRPCGAKPGSTRPQNLSSQHRRRPARRPQRPALLPRCQPSR